MINADAFNEVLAQLKGDSRATNALVTTARKMAYYDVSPEARDLVGRALRKKLMALPDEDIAGIRACIKALRNVYAC